MNPKSSAVATYREYLPAVLQPSAAPGWLERRLSAPFRRTYEVWGVDR